MEAKERYWLAMSEVVYYRNIVDLKLERNRKCMMWSNILFAIIGTGALGTFLVYHQNLALLCCVAAQCYQACLPFLPWNKDVRPLHQAAVRYDLLGEQMESVWWRIDDMNDASILAKADQFKKRCTKLIGGLFREGIGFESYDRKACGLRDVYMKRFNSETAFAKEDKPEA